MVYKGKYANCWRWQKLVWFENRIWAIGGHDGSDAISKVESYDPTSNSWQSEAHLTIARNWATAWVANGRIYVGGGKMVLQISSIEVFDPSTINGQVQETFLKINISRCCCLRR